jgi:hypothetical protein
LTIVSNAVYPYLLISVFNLFAYIPRNDIARSYNSSIYLFILYFCGLNSGLYIC